MPLIKAGFIYWQQFLFLRVLMDDKGTDEQNVRFLYNYFDVDHSGEVKEMNVIFLIHRVGLRITRVQSAKLRKQTANEQD